MEIMARCACGQTFIKFDEDHIYCEYCARNLKKRNRNVLRGTKKSYSVKKAKNIAKKREYGRLDKHS